MNLRQFLELFGSAGVRAQLQKFARRPDIKALAAIRKSDDTLSAQAFTEIPDAWPDDTRYVWVKPTAPHSRTQHALALLSKGMSVKDAAAKANVSTVAVYRAIKRRAGKPVCECCGQVIRDAFRNPAPLEDDA